MSEISREFIINWLKQRGNCSNESPRECCEKECEDCPNNYDESMEIEIEKAIISDMQKLEEINNAFKDITCEEDLYYKEKECGCYDILRDIFMIIRGGENDD